MSAGPGNQFVVTRICPKTKLRRTLEMKVIVVGAGIAGLSAAIGLRKAGHEVLVRTKFLSKWILQLRMTIMALDVLPSLMHHVQPNASRIIARWGFDFKRARLVTAKSFTFVSGDDLRPLLDGDLSHIEDDYGSGYFYSHRVDLHNELKLLATGVEGEGKPAVIQNKSEVVGYDTINGSVILANGTTMTADLIVGADGIHSSAVKEVTGHENPAVPTGISVFRCLMPVHEIREDPECAFLLEDLEGKGRSFNAPNQTHRRIVWYPCREYVLFSHLLLQAARAERFTIPGWNITVPKETFINELDDFHPALRTLLAKAKDVRLWKLLFRAPLPTWHRGKLVIIGDAAHPMLPYQGQAGAQAIEDGCALGTLLSNLPSTSPSPSPTTLSTRLTSFETVRRKRASAVQIFSSRGADETLLISEDVRPFLEVGEVVPANQKETQEYIFRHDVLEACERELERIGEMEMEMEKERNEDGDGDGLLGDLVGG
ncbi:hypothetical protein NHQ30_008965 [Ciborinia camelliae]|nr:hypothetical protein NHQ30_008965 [Ciborinia camelliae]